MSFYSIIYNTAAVPILGMLNAILKRTNSKIARREANWLDALNNVPPKVSKRILFHAASMGEFEQAKPVIEEIKKQKPEISIICSFFSPSGYETQKDYEYADAVVYIPFDNKKKAQFYLDKIAPDIAVFVRYEIWRNHLEELRKRGIPTLLICATKPNSRILTDFPVIKGFTRDNYSLFNEIYTIGKNHTKFFNSLDLESKIIDSNDTRADRIIENVEQSQKSPLLPPAKFADDEFILVAGSTWPEDETQILQAEELLNRKIRIIFVPHEPNEENIRNLRGKMNESILLSEIENIKDAGVIAEKIKNRHIVVDSIGKLLRLYSLADAAYIGGAFRDGVHSVSEPAGYGIPLCSGPNIDVSTDAVELEEDGALTIIKNPMDLSRWLKEIIDNNEFNQNAGKIAREYIYAKQGTSKSIAEKVLNWF